MSIVRRSISITRRVGSACGISRMARVAWHSALCSFIHSMQVMANLGAASNPEYEPHNQGPITAVNARRSPRQMCSPTRNPCSGTPRTVTWHVLQRHDEDVTDEPQPCLRQGVAPGATIQLANGTRRAGCGTNAGRGRRGSTTGQGAAVSNAASPRAI